MLEIKKITVEEFEDKIYDQYIKLFPKEEQRDWNTIKKVYSDIGNFYAITSDNILIGFVMLEKLGDYPYYLDYFAIFEEYQSKGFGSESIKVLLDEIVKDDGLIGEIEKVSTDNLTTVRRWKFYEKLGFKKYDDVFFYYNVLFNLIVYPKTYNLGGLEIANILLEYYKINIGEDLAKTTCKIIE